MLFIFDENFPPDFVRGFSIIERGNKRSPLLSVIQHSNEFMGSPGASDEDIIQKASGKDAVIITHDSDFKKIKHYKPLLIQHSVGFIYFKTPKKEYRYWDMVKAIILKWEDLKDLVSKSTHPFALEIAKSGQLQLLKF